MFALVLPLVVHHYPLSQMMAPATDALCSDSGYPCGYAAPLLRTGANVQYSIAVRPNGMDKSMVASIDTGSSNFALMGTNTWSDNGYFNCSLPGSGCTDNNIPVSASYGDGSYWSGGIMSVDVHVPIVYGNGVEDTITLNEAEVTQTRSPTDFFRPSNINGLDKGTTYDYTRGIIGVAGASLAAPAGSPQELFMDNPFWQHSVFGLLLCGEFEQQSAIQAGEDVTYDQGAIVMGGIYPFKSKQSATMGLKLYTGEIFWTPIAEAVEGNTGFYYFATTGFGVKGSRNPAIRLLTFHDAVDLQATGQKLLADSGTTMAYIPQTMYTHMTTYLCHTPPGAASNPPYETAACLTGLQGPPPDDDDYAYVFELSQEEMLDMPTFYLDIARWGNDKESFRIYWAPQDYLRQVGTAYGKSKFQLGVGVGSSGMYIMGDVLLEGYYTIFDRTNKRLGMAPGAACDTHHTRGPIETIPLNESWCAVLDRKSVV